MQPHVETGLLRLKITNFAKVPLISTALHYWMIRTILIALEHFKTGPQTSFPLNTSAGDEAVLKGLGFGICKLGIQPARWW